MIVPFLDLTRFRRIFKKRESEFLIIVIKYLLEKYKRLSEENLIRSEFCAEGKKRSVYNCGKKKRIIKFRNGMKRKREN